MFTRSHAGVAGFVLALIAVAAVKAAAIPQTAPKTLTASAALQAGGRAAQAPVSSAGAVTGRIKIEGTAPAARVIRMGSDPICQREGRGATSDVLVVGAGNALQNVFVYVKDGLGGKTFPAPKTPIVLDQKGCRYQPHVFGVQVGQPVQILNSDPTLHNVHAVPKANVEFNFGQPIAGMKSLKTFDKPEIMVPFRCDVHGWMNAYAGVVAHPFFAVSKADGSFEIKGLPAGTYTIEAWHERLGVQTSKITVDAKGTGSANFAFKMKA
jgi:plastocyanin